MRLLALVAVSAATFPTVCASCDDQDAVASKLTAAISDHDIKWGITVDVPVALGPDERLDVPIALVNLSDTTSVSMDCIAIFEGVEPGTILGVFHCGQGGEEGRNALYVAQAEAVNGSVPGKGDWIVTGKLSASASMGHVVRAPDGEQILLAYELESPSGNRVAIRLYPSLADLASGGYWLREVQLTRDVVGADGGVISAGNVGTPSIRAVTANEDGSLALALFFHYYTSSDLPGVASVTFPATGDGVVSEWYEWSAEFAADQNNAMRMAQAVGKIGQRAELDLANGGHVQLYEAQMADAGEEYYGWLSWRLFVYELGCEGQPASQLNLTLDSHLQTFANPHASVVGDWLYVGAFVPSEPFDAAKAESYASYDSAKCPSCASHPMAGAGAPAQPGSFLVSVRLSGVV